MEDGSEGGKQGDRKEREKKGFWDFLGSSTKARDGLVK